MSPGSRVALAMLLVAGAGPAGFFAYRFLAAEHLIAPPGSARASAPSGAPAQQGQQPSIPLSAQPAASPNESGPGMTQKPIPESLPDLSLPDTAGASRRLSDWRGHPLVVNFWATWCEPCRRELPLLESLRKQAAREGSPSSRLEVIGIAVDDRDAVLPYIHRMGVDYPVLIGGEDRGLSAIAAFGMQAVLPFSVFADERGDIVAVKVGELHPEDARLILAKLADVDDGRLPLKLARDEIASGLAGLAAARARAGTSAPGS